jgi:hypothetical protein
MKRRMNAISLRTETAKRSCTAGLGVARSRCRSVTVTSTPPARRRSTALPGSLGAMASVWKPRRSSGSRRRSIWLCPPP